MRYLLVIAMLSLCVSCMKRKKEYLNNATTNFQENFENYSSAEQLFDPGPWIASQLTLDVNSIAIDTQNVYSGTRALKMSATTTEGDVVSKACIFKNDFGFQDGDRFITECWFHLQCSQPKYIFLLDFEDPAVISSGPGLRLMLNENGALCVERKKMNASTLRQNQGAERILPLNEWVHLKIEMLLDQRRRGSIKLWQNDELILNYNNVQTVPRDLLYFTQGTSGILRQIEVGITANSSGAPAVLYIDDLKVIPVN